MRDQPEETRLQSSAMHIYTSVKPQRPKKSIPAASHEGWGGGGGGGGWGGRGSFRDQLSAEQV